MAMIAYLLTLGVLASTAASSTDPATRSDTSAIVVTVCWGPCSSSTGAAGALATYGPGILNTSPTTTYTVTVMESYAACAPGMDLSEGPPPTSVGCLETYTLFPSLLTGDPFAPVTTVILTAPGLIIPTPTPTSSATVSVTNATSTTVSSTLSTQASCPMQNPPAAILPMSMPAGSLLPLQQCLINPNGPDQPGPGCAGMLQHVMNCYEGQSPWTNPYDTSQSAAFQSCLCQTSPEGRFSPDSVLWRNFTGCSLCVFNFGTVAFATLLVELTRIENFCSSQNPVAYLFLVRFRDWLGILHPNIVLEQPPLTGGITLIGTLASLFTTTPPLANLAYGASAPVDGSLGLVTPTLITYGTLQSNSVGTITSLVTWLPTATTLVEIEMASAAESAMSAASRELSSALSSLAKNSGGHGRSFPLRCLRPGPGSTAAVYCSPVLKAALVGIVAIDVVIVLQL